MRAALFFVAKPIAIALMGLLIIAALFEVWAFLRLADFVTGTKVRL